MCKSADTFQINFQFIVIVVQIWITNIEAANVQRAVNRRGSGNEGKFNQHSFDTELDILSKLSSEIKPQGRYVESLDKWAYKPDTRGKYVHVNIPYNGKVTKNLDNQFSKTLNKQSSQQVDMVLL